MATNTLLQLKTLFYRYLGAYRSLTATGGSTAKFTMASLADLEADKYAGWQLRVTSGTASGDLRRLVAGPNPSGDLEPKRVFSAAIASTNTGELWGNSIDGGDELTELFNEALKKRKPLDETQLTIVDNSRYYDITSHIKDPADVRRVYFRSLDLQYDEPWDEVPVSWFKVEHHLTSVQTVAISGTPTGGTYTLTYDDETTSALDYNASAASVQTALRALTHLDSVTVSAAGTTPNFTHTVTFVGVTTVAQTLSATSSLTGGSSPAIAIAAGASVPAWWLEIPYSTTDQSPATQELWMRHYKQLTAFTADTSTVQDRYAEWLAWEAALLHCVTKLSENVDTGRWKLKAEEAMKQALAWRSIHEPYVPAYIRHERPIV